VASTAGVAERGLWSSRAWKVAVLCFLFVLAVLEAIAVAIHLQNMDMMCEPVEQCASQSFCAECLRPFIEWQI